MSKGIQTWTELFDQKNHDRKMKMREEKENKFEAILKEIITTKSASMITNPRSEMNGTQIIQTSGLDPKTFSLLEFTHLTLKLQTQKLKITHLERLI